MNEKNIEDMIDRLRAISTKLGWKPYWEEPVKIVTVVLPDPPLDVFVWIGTTWIAVYEN